MNTLLYVDDEVENLTIFKSLLKKEYNILVASSAAEAKQIIKEQTVDLILTDQKMPDQTGLELLKELVPQYPDMVRIIITGYSQIETVIQAINDGKIFYFISKPWDLKHLRSIIEKGLESRNLKLQNAKLLEELKVTNLELSEKNAVLQDANEEIKKLKSRLEQENQYLRREISAHSNPSEIVYESKIFEEVLQKVRQVASTNATVLITGQTGTGKELLARAIHTMSNRSNRSMVKVNCAALPANLIESELFGHVKGAFTGALVNKIGLFELADKGTIFLDEIGELPLDLQAKLLRVLQDGDFHKLGEPKATKVDVRVIAATNRDIEEAVNQGSFRSDLFFRLNVFPIHNPSLQERAQDIPALVHHFVNKHSKKIGKEIKLISPATIEELMRYDWPGNIRELENVIERLIITSPSNELSIGDWKPISAIKKDDGISMLEAEKLHIIRVLEKTKWRIRGSGGSADILNLKPTTLASRMKKLGIYAPQKPDD